MESSVETRKVLFSRLLWVIFFASIVLANVTYIRGAKTSLVVALAIPSTLIALVKALRVHNATEN